jgi:hypothetical protein
MGLAGQQLRRDRSPGLCRVHLLPGGGGKYVTVYKDGRIDLCALDGSCISRSLGPEGPEPVDIMSVLCTVPSSGGYFLARLVGWYG